MSRWQHRLATLAAGGVSLSIISAAGDVNLASVLASFLAQILSVLAALIFGGNAQTLLQSITNQQFSF